MGLYHFTSREHLPAILNSGLVLPSESNIHPSIERAGPDVVWLTDTESSGLGHGLAGSATLKGAVRIEVDVPAIRWLEWEWTAHMAGWWREAIVRAGGGDEAAAHWYVWPAPIRRSRWLAVDVVSVEE